ncbi:MAG TPA: sulfate ABC transporter substrate-binding protein [Blastocatellia bacterium]|nr:sulfate ABC transporter substrate-binding protein [Blastocatellia bacterium]
MIRILVWLCLPILTACHGAAGSGKVTLTLGGYTTPREAYNRAIIPAFQQYWRAKTGREVDFQESYQASGAQSRAIISGFEADIAALSLEGDIDRIARSGLIQHDWKSKKHRGIVSTSIAVIAVRSGNPAGIHDWPDLTRPGLKILMPDPKTSGGAQWNVVAIYGAALRGFTDVAKDDPETARQFLGRLLANVSIMDKGARESITNFEKGVGHVAITYENEVLVARQAGRQYDYVVPRSTVLIENPVALVDTYVDKHGVREVAEAFIDFLFTPEAQRAYAKYGLRPVEPEISGEQQISAQFPAVQDLWKIDFMGGWKRVGTDLFGPAGAYTRTFEQLHSSP